MTTIPRSWETKNQNILIFGPTMTRDDFETKNEPGNLDDRQVNSDHNYCIARGINMVRRLQLIDESFWLSFVDNRLLLTR